MIKGRKFDSSRRKKKTAKIRWNIQHILGVIC